MSTLKHMLTISKFDDFEIIAGEKGLYAELKHISVMDAPDIYNWMKGGELLITTGYCLKDNLNSIDVLIKKLSEKNVVGLGIKLGRFINSFPISAINIANELNFPILDIPVKYAFTDIINPVLSNLVNEQAIKLMYSEKIHKSFTELVITGGETSQILNILSDILGTEIIFYNSYLNKFYVSYNSLKMNSIIENFSLQKMLQVFHYHMVSNKFKNYGYIILPNYNSKKQLKEYTEIALAHCSIVLIIDIQNKISSLQTQQRLKDEFVQDLILKNIKSIDEVISRSIYYGWHFAKGMFCLLIDIDDYKNQYILNDKSEKRLKEIKELILKISKKILESYFPQIIYTNFSDSIVFLLNPLYKNEEAFKKKLEKICLILRQVIKKESKFTVLIGIGKHKNSVLDIHESFKESQRAVQLGRLLYKKNATVFFNNLGIYTLLSEIVTNPVANNFYKSNLQALISYDNENNTDFLETLRIIIKNDWNLKNVSKEMFLHYNTVKYRASRIMEILDIDIKNPETKLNLVISLKLLDMLQ